MSIDTRQKSETYLLTLASLLGRAKMLVVLVEDLDGNFSYNRAKFTEEGNWINTVGHMSCLAHDIMAKQVVWVPCNADGSEVQNED